jgi:hypothetical protein
VVVSCSISVNPEAKAYSRDQSAKRDVDHWKTLAGLEAVAKEHRFSLGTVWST